MGPRKAEAEEEGGGAECVQLCNPSGLSQQICQTCRTDKTTRVETNYAQQPTGRRSTGWRRGTSLSPRVRSSKHFHQEGVKEGKKGQSNRVVGHKK